MKVVPLLFFLLATSIQGGFAALDNVNPLTNPDLPPTVRAHLESRILEWLCPRIKMTASNYIRSRLYPLSGSLSGSLSSISAWGYTLGSSDIIPPLWTRPFFINRPKLQSWLEQLTPAQKQRLDDALIVSIAAYLKTHPKAFMVSCYFINTTQNEGGGTIYPQVSVYTINGDAGDTVTFPSNQGGAPYYPNIFCTPSDSWWYLYGYENPLYFICNVGYTNMWFDVDFFSAISSITYSHGGKQFVLTQKNPVAWSN